MHPETRRAAGWLTSALLLSTLLTVAQGEEPTQPAERATVKEARRQAEGLHVTVHETLQIVHQRYYFEDEGLPIPAATLDEVFEKLAESQGIELRWLAVEGQAMSVDHVAKGAFERAAVAALKAGKPSHEQVEAGVYRRAGPITLTNSCLKCHVPDRTDTEDRTAGLIVAIPVREP